MSKITIISNGIKTEIIIKRFNNETRLIIAKLEKNDNRQFIYDDKNVRINRGL